MKESRETEAVVTLMDGDVAAQVKIGTSSAEARIGLPQPNDSGVLDSVVIRIVSSEAAGETARVFARVAELLAEHENALALKQASVAP